VDAYYERYGGAVVSAAIDKYCYAIVSNGEVGPTEIRSSSDYQNSIGVNVSSSSDADLPVPRAVVDYFGRGQGLSIFIAFQVPSDTGLGSSTASGIALIQALQVLDGSPLSAHELAELACQIEIGRLGRPIGKQDAFALAFGGLNYIQFRSDGVTVDPIILAPDLKTALESRLMLFFTGRWQDSGRIWTEQRRNTQRNRASVIDALHDIKEAAVRLNDDLRRGEISAVGNCLHKSWMAKRRLAQGVTDPWIDQWYDSAINAGAKGGKIVGAGGGGFMLLYCEPDRQSNVTQALQGAGLAEVPFRFESEGASVLLKQGALGQRFQLAPSPRGESPAN